MDWDSIYWIIDSLRALPAVLWMFFGVGIPWSLAVLPRPDWRDRPLVIALALALGPGWVTAWMLVLGALGGAQEQVLLRFDLVFAGSVVIALIGIGLAWRTLRQTTASPAGSIRLTLDVKLIIALVAVALVLRWLTTAYWPFTTYDPLWVYGYEGRLYTLAGFIPEKIGYYPQFLPLQYTYSQLAVGAVDDHAARAVLPFIHLGAILAAYVLGNRLINRRTGLIAAALWALYPHVGDWAHIGDLEIPLTFTFTLSAAFFLMAWTQPDNPYRRRYAVLAGLIFGIAMWTKPTAGAFVWGVALLVALDLFRTRFDWRAWWPRFETAALTGLACIPLGGAWYLRNIMLGHDAINLPDGFWQTQARQSGDMFGWLLLALAIGLLYLYLGRDKRPPLLPGLLGVGLLLIGLVPSIPLVNPTRLDPPDSRLTVIELGFVFIGVAVLSWTFMRTHLTETEKSKVRKAGWGLLLALPYFITFFISYSYHYRLSFPIVPLLILPSAALLAHWLPAETFRAWTPQRRGLLLAIIFVISIPGIVSTLFDTLGKTGWLWSDEHPDDDSRYMVQNPSIMFMVFGLRDYIAEYDTEPVVIAPGDQRLQFFFPLMDITNDALPNQPDYLPTRLSQLDGATHFIYTAQGIWQYEDAGIKPLENQIVASLGRKQIMTQVKKHSDATLRYELYELAIDNRFLPPTEGPILHFVEDDIHFGDYLRYIGDNVTNLTFTHKENIYFDFQWEVLQPLPADYWLSVQLLNEDDNQIYAEWVGPIAVSEHAYYPTTLWEPGETVIESRVLQLEEPETVPGGRNYRVLLSFVNPETGERLPVITNGETTGDTMPMVAPFKAVTNYSKVN